MEFTDGFFKYTLHEKIYDSSAGTTCVKCPICEGRGLVPPGFYSNDRNTINTEEQICRSCDGKGVIFK